MRAASVSQHIRPSSTLRRSAENPPVVVARVPLTGREKESKPSDSAISDFSWRRPISNICSQDLANSSLDLQQAATE
jgi:hypothetical protein